MIILFKSRDSGAANRLYYNVLDYHHLLFPGEVIDITIDNNLGEYGGIKLNSLSEEEGLQVLLRFS